MSVAVHASDMIGRRPAAGKKLSTKSADPVDRHVGARVRMRRMMLGISQEKLAEPLGVTFQQVQKYEKGTNRIGSSRLSQIATALEVPIAFFFEGAPGGDLRHAKQGDLGSMDPMFELRQTRDGIALAGAFNSITDGESRAAVVKIAEIFAAKRRK